MSLSEVVDKFLIFLLKRSPEELKWAKRTREMQYRITNEIPTQSNELKIAYLTPGFVEACTPILSNGTEYS